MKTKLFTKEYICILAANFLLYFGFWLLIPIFPFYITDTYNCTGASLGVVLCCYTISELGVRPFSGYLMDNFPRKPIYLFCYLCCTCLFLGYIHRNLLFIFIFLRILHGLAFGGVSVGGNTLVIDIMPAPRRGEGLGYYGLTNNSAMALGPMVGLLMHNSFSYKSIFLLGFTTNLIGLYMANKIKHGNEYPKKDTSSGLISTTEKSSHKTMRLDRFFLIKGIPASIALLLLSIPYATTTNFVAMFAEEIQLNVITGFFFCLMAIGIGVSRIFAGKKVDQGYITECIHYSYYPIILALFLLFACKQIITVSLLGAQISFFVIPLLLGSGFGILFPAMNSLYLNLGTHNQRATATSTYLTAWGIGIGLGIFIGSSLAQYFSFSIVYLMGSILSTISLLIFTKYVTPHYQKNKLC